MSLRMLRTNPRSRKNGAQDVPDYYTFLSLNGEHDENYEIALDEHGDYAYHIIGQVMASGHLARRMWSMAGTRLTPEVMAKFVTLPPDFYPETSIVVVGFNGSNYSVYLMSKEDVRARVIKKGIPTADEAEREGRMALKKFRTPAA